MDIFSSKFLILFTVVLMATACSKENIEKNQDAKKIAQAPAAVVINKNRKLLDKLSVNVDQMTDVRFYHHPSYHFNGQNVVRLYIAEGKNGKLTLRFVVMYYGDFWVFANRAWSKIDGVSFDLPTESQWDRDNGGSKVWETSDLPIDDVNSLILIKKFATSKTPTIRFEGPKGHVDFKPTVKQLSMMQDVIAAYVAAEGIPLN